MTSIQLVQTYNFHDCDIVLPFAAESNTATVTFLLATHLQYDDIKKRYGNFAVTHDSYLMLTLCLTSNAPITVCNRAYTGKRSTGEVFPLDPEAIDPEMDFLSLHVSAQGDILLQFDGSDESIKEICFSSPTIKIVEERLASRAEL